MAYLNVKDFKQGMDRRRSKSIGVPGALWDAKNVHITRGGDIENAKKFVSLYSVANTFGMAVAQGQLYVFGSTVAPSLTAEVQYQRLQFGSAGMVDVLDSKPFNGKLYVIASFDDGNICHFYDGTRVTQWDTIADAACSYATLADYLADLINNETDVEASAVGSSIIVKSRVPGTAFTIAQATLDGGANNDQTITLTETQANVAAQDEVQATATVTVTGGTASPGTNQITSVTINGVEILANDVDWESSNADTAEILAGDINLDTQTHGYSADAVGAVVTITAAAGTGTTPNGYNLVVDNQGDVTTTHSLEMTGGQTAVTAVAQVYEAEFGGTMQALDKFTLTINGTAYYATPRASATGTFAYVRDKRVFCPAGPIVRYCKLSDPTDWTDSATSSGAGFISVSTDSEGYERIVSMAPYDTQTAIFGRQMINLYQLGTDAALFGFVRSLDNTGCRSARATRAYGNLEVLYLDDSGIRSLRARQGTDTPYAADIGSAIDDFIQEQMRDIALDKIARSVSVVDPVDGRYLMAMGERIYILSLYPSNKITAWTYYEPGFEITEFARTKNRLYGRAEDTIYLYGGIDGQTWPEDDEIECVVETPFVSGDTPATLKERNGVDFDVSNEWLVTVATDSNRPEHYDTYGTVSKITGGMPHINAPGSQASWSMKFVCEKGGRATISSFQSHYDPNEAR
jgi:hypothetical protein